jgi:hypothetical protein
MKFIPSPPQPAPLSNVNAYTSWPGGIDPSVRLYNIDNQKGGRRHRRNTRKSYRKSRKNTRKSRR